MVEAAGHRVGGRAPGGGVVGLDVRLEVLADPDEPGVGPGGLDVLAAVLAVEVLQVEVQAPVGEQLAAAGANLACVVSSTPTC